MPRALCSQLPASCAADSSHVRAQAGGSIYVRYSKSISYVPQLLRASGGSGGRALNQNSGGNGQCARTQRPFSLAIR